MTYDPYDPENYLHGQSNFMNDKQKAYLRSCTPAQMMDIRSITAKMTELSVIDPEIRRLESSLKAAKTRFETVKIIQKLLVKAGTDVDQNDNDPYGDGDQTLILGKELEPHRQILRNLFAAGGDIEHHMIGNSGLTPFSWSCVMGDTKAVENTLKATFLRGQQPLIQLLEHRQTSMRIPPLLLTVALSKHKQTVSKYSKRKVADMDHVGVFRALIRYGARPDAKDVAGKTGKWKYRV